jgi:hypothetical protein
MQPYFFPYLGYFELLYRADCWVAFDTAQYIRRGWINRNRILHPVEGWTYITMPVRKHRRDTPIADIRIADDSAWRRRIEGQLLHYRRHAPHFEPVLALVRDCLAVEETSVSRLNVAILEKTCRFVGIPLTSRFLSEMNVKLGPIDQPSDWGLRLAEALHATEYVNAPGGRDLYDAAKFAAHGIGLTILSSVTWRYDTPGYRFEPSLSILDTLMWNSPDAVREILNTRLNAASRAQLAARRSTAQEQGT